jgi:hypothetical protein
VTCYPALKVPGYFHIVPLGRNAVQRSVSHKSPLGRNVAVSTKMARSMAISLENAVENHFTAKPPRAQKTYSKINIHPFGETIDHLGF